MKHFETNLLCICKNTSLKCSENVGYVRDS